MTGGGTTAKHRDSATTCQRHAGAVASAVAARAGASCAGNIPLAPVSQPVAKRWQREGENSHKRPRKPDSLQGRIWGLPSPTNVLRPCTKDLRGRTPPPAPRTSGAHPRSCSKPPPRQTGAAQAAGALCWRSHSMLGEAVPRPRCPARLGCPEAVPNLFPFPISVCPCRGGNGGKSSKTLLLHKLPERTPGAAGTLSPAARQGLPPPSPRARSFISCPCAGPWVHGSFVCRHRDGGGGHKGSRQACAPLTHTCVHGKRGTCSHPPAGIARVLGSLGTPKLPLAGAGSPALHEEGHGWTQPLGGCWRTPRPLGVLPPAARVG